MDDRLLGRRVLLATYLLLAFALPFANYRDVLFLVLLAVFSVAPFLTVAICLAATGIAALLKRRHAVSALAAALFAVTMTYAVWQCTHGAPAWLRFGAFADGYRALSFPLAIADGLAVAGFLIAVPAGAIVDAARQWRAGRRHGAMLLASIPFCGIAALYFGTTAADAATVVSCIQPMRSALAAVKSGKHLPPESQAFPVSVLRTNPDVAVEALESFMDFPSYIAYDELDGRETDVAARVHEYETPACSSFHARRIWGRYYWVDVVC